MTRRVIGLDIGTNAVRVADVEIGDEITLHAFGQVALPLDAMREGEVLDPEAVSAAISRLWRELGLKKGAVRVGIGGPRVIVRMVDLPAMPDNELEGAIRFQAGELIPIPLDDAVIDFQVLEPAGAPADESGPDAPADGVPPAAAPPPIPTSITADDADAPTSAVDPTAELGGDGTPPPATEPAAPDGTNRVLVAAAHKETVARLVQAVRGAGLKVAAVDLVPLALVRSLGRRPGPLGPGAEGIVCVGGGVTVVVVHENGVPRFVRMLGTGGRALTDAIARDLDLTPETAEALKRQGASSQPELAPRVAAALETPLADLTEEIRGSLDFWRTQTDSGRLLSVTVTGGASVQPGLTDSLTRLLGVPVDAARPREGLQVGDIGFPPEEIAGLDPYLAVPVGLALGGAPGPKRINLAGDREGVGGDGRRFVLVAAAVAIVVVLVLGFLSYSKINQLNDAEDDLSAQQSTNARIQREIDALADAREDQEQIDIVLAQVDQVLVADVSWASILQEIGRMIPDDAWLTGFQGDVSTEPAAAAGAAADTAAGLSGDTEASGATTPDATAPAAASAINGTVTFTATGLDFTSVAFFLQRISQIPSFTDVWVSTATSGELGGRSIVTFDANAALTDSARADRAPNFTGSDGETP